MTGQRGDATLERIRSGTPLTAADDRHMASCGACQRAASEIRVLEARLRDATRPLAATPIPDEVLEVEPMRPRALERLGSGRSMGLAAATVVALAAIGVGFAIGPWRPAVAIDPSATPAPTDAEASPSAAASTAPSPTGTATPAPSAPPVAAHLVGPGDVCADGRAGFIVRLPTDTYAERAAGEGPACRVFGSASDSGGRQNLEPRIYATVFDQPPAFEGATELTEEERTSDGGVRTTRFEVHIPESDALAARNTVSYVVELTDGRFLLMETESRDEAWVDRLDAIAQGLQLTQPITVSESAAAAAADLFAVRDVCEDPERGFVVTFPEDWWTNTAVEDLPACSWFAPTFFEFESSDLVPEEVEITVEVVDGDVGTTSGPIGWETITLLDRPGTRWLVEVDGATRYEYIMNLGNTPEGGPNLVARTVAAEDDLDLAMAVLDRLVQRMSFAQPPPGASSTNPPLSGDPVVATATNGDFRLELVVQQERYRAGQPIIADMTLTYLGDEPTVRLWGSGLGVVGSRLRQVDGTIEHGWASTTDCRPHEIAPAQPLRRPFVKSGSWSPDEPDGAFYEAYFRDPLLRLPPGRWEITAVTGFTAGGDDCGDGPSGDLEVSVEITVEP